MKLHKIFTIAIAAFAMTACSDNDEPKWNTDGDVVVEMGLIEQSDGTFSNVIHTKEGRDMIKLPVEIKGKRNGNIEITFVVKSEYENTATDDENLFITTHTAVIFPEDDTYNLEITIFDDDVMNEPRWCDVTIESVKGGTIGEQNFTTVEIKDNDTEPYDRCAGKWILRTAVPNDAGVLVESQKIIRLQDYDEDSKHYNKQYKVRDVLGDDVLLIAMFTYDKETNAGTVSFDYGQHCGSIKTSSGDALAVEFLELYLEDGYYGINRNGATVFNYSAENPKITEMTVEPSQLSGVYPMWGFINGYSIVTQPYYILGMERIKTNQ